MSRITGRRGEVWATTQAGLPISNQQLTIAASKIIGGTTYTNRFYGTTTRTVWNPRKYPSVRLVGIAGDNPAIVPNTGVSNNVIVPPLKYFRDNSSTVPISVTSPQTLAVTRAPSGDSQWTMISINKNTGTAMATAGIAITGTNTFNDTFGAAGGPAYIPADNILIGATKLVGGAAAVVTQAEITQQLSNGTPLVERYDIPSYDTIPLEGGVLFQKALLACHTSNTTAQVFASYYDLYSQVTKLGDVDGWDLTKDQSTVELEAMNDLSPLVDFSGAGKFSGKFSRFYVQDDTAWKLGVTVGVAYIRLYPDSDDSTRYWEGVALIPGWSTAASITAGIKENLSFIGYGAFELRGI